jgi:VTC domain
MDIDETTQNLASHRTASDALLSPALASSAGGLRYAYEMKFVLAASLAAELQKWAQQHLKVDPHASPEHNDGYQISTLYLDTPQKAMFHRQEGYKTKKYRVRRYALHTHIYLECKQRRGDKTRKQRQSWPAHELAKFATEEPLSLGEAGAFKQTLQTKNLQPSCHMTYWRSAYMAHDGNSTLRLTLDRNIRGRLTQEWNVQPLEETLSPLTDQVICELKFHTALPQLFKQCIAEHSLQPAAFSKYRRLLQRELGIAPGEILHE